MVRYPGEMACGQEKNPKQLQAKLNGHLRKEIRLRHCITNENVS